MAFHHVPHDSLRQMMRVLGALCLVCFIPRPMLFHMLSLDPLPNLDEFRLVDRATDASEYVSLKKKLHVTVYIC